MKNIKLCPDGKYRWVYELSLYRNPTILFLVWKIFFWIMAGLWAFLVILGMGDSDFWFEGFLDITKTYCIIIVGMLVLCAVGYYVYALIMGGKYCVMFEMHDNGVLHQQMDRQVKKAEAIGAITALLGVMTKNPTTAGIGLTSSAHTSMYSDFKKVRSVKFYPRRNVIKVNAPFNKNQVYAEKEDFEFVQNYILAHIPQGTKTNL